MKVADSFWKRFVGLMGLKDQDRSVLIPDCRGVHTFGMRYPLTLFWFREDGQIIMVDRGVNPNRVRFCSGACGVLECGKGRVSDEQAQSLIFDWVRHQRIMKQSFVSDDSGQALVETALLLPVIILFLFGFIQVGLIMVHKQQMLYVNNYGVQVGSITNDDARMFGAIEETFDPSVDPIVVDIDSFRFQTEQGIVSTDRRYKDTITVRMQWEYPLLISIGSFDSVTIQTQSSARILCREEHPPYTCD